MITTIYLIRHSKSEVIEDSIGDTLQEKNENAVLSQEGHSIIENISKSEELKNIDVIYSSNYKRAFQTAEHIAKENNLNIIVDKRLGERKFGISSWDEKPKDFEIRQFSDENFKTPNGECIKEVQKRMYEAKAKYYQNKEIDIVNSASKKEYLQVQTGILEIDTMLSVLN